MNWMINIIYNRTIERQWTDGWMDGWIHIDYPHVWEKMRISCSRSQMTHLCLLPSSFTATQNLTAHNFWNRAFPEKAALTVWPWRKPPLLHLLTVNILSVHACVHYESKTPDIAKVSVSLPIMPPDNDIAALWLTISFQRHSGSESARKVNDCLLMWIVNSSPLSVYKTNVIIHNVTMTLTHTHTHTHTKTHENYSSSRCSVKMIIKLLNDMWPWTTKPVLSRWGIFVVIAKNRLHGSKWYIFLL